MALTDAYSTPPSASKRELFLQLWREQTYPVDFSDYMQAVLYHPELGYYQQDRPLIGERGDFITAPEISPIFSHGIAHAVCEEAERMNQPLSNFSLLEIGAGNGTMAFHLLEKLFQEGQLPKKYQILETSQALATAQKKQLSKLKLDIFQRVEWLSAVPEQMPRIILANEVVDALPFSVGVTRQLNQEWCWFPKKLQWVEDPESPFFTWVESEAEPLPKAISEQYCAPNRVMELPGRLLPWLQALRASVTVGSLIVIDYAERDAHLKISHPEGSLRCYANHRVNDDPLVHWGEQDITASVNLDMLIREADLAGWVLDGWQTQAKFLLSQGIDRIPIDTMTDAERFRVSQQIQMLTMPNAMGEKYKVISFTAP